MVELKTKVTKISASQFVNSIADATKRRDCKTLVAMMKGITGKPAKMWGSTIVGFGSYHYTYSSGREGDWFVTGFSPRKRELTIYIMPGFSNYAELMKKLGKFKTGKSCLYIKKLDDVNMEILRSLISQSVADMEAMYDCS